MQTFKTFSRITMTIKQVPDKLRRSKSKAFCLLCRIRVNLKSFQQAADYCRTNELEVQFLAERNELHRIHNSKGEIRICAESLRELRTRNSSPRIVIIEPLTFS